MRKLKIFEHITLDGVIQHSADDGNFLGVHDGGFFRDYIDGVARFRPVALGEEALERADGDGLVDLPATAGGFAGIQGWP